MTLEWTRYKGGPEEVYWSKFKEVNEYPMLVTDFKGDGNGYVPKNTGPFVHQGFTYKAIEKTSHKGNKFWVIQRKPHSELGEDSEEQKAHDSVNNAEGAKKGHEENIQMHKEKMESDQKTRTSLDNLNDTLAQILAELRLRSKVVE